MNLKGKGASPGIALASVFVLKAERFEFSSERRFDAGRETKRWQDARNQVLQDLEALEKKFRASGPEESAEIAQAHLMMAQDPEWTDGVEELLNQGYQSEYCVHEASEKFAKMIESLEDPYLRQRAQDIRDVASRVMRLLSSGGTASPRPTGPFVLVAEDILPSELLSFHGPEIKGLVLQGGNPTSHTTILARTFELPLVLGVHGLMEVARTGAEVIVSGTSGNVTFDPTPDQKREAQAQIQAEAAEREELKGFIKLNSVSADKVHFEVAANLNSILDLELAVSKGAEGVGLFRTEFLLMDRVAAPTEDEQYQIYRKVIEAMAPHRAVIRTYDIGGDKQVEFLKLPVEDNPFLGLRGLRLCFKEKELFATQLRALLRAAKHGKLGIMAPMVTRVEEVLEFKSIVAQIQAELGDKAGKPEVGIMIEVPAAALVADQLAKHVDFFSVGTNDLLQYLCAADRMNGEVADLHDTYHPGVLRTLKMVADGVRGTRTWLGICGELGANSDYLPLLLAMGFHELSVSPGAVLRTRKRVRSLSVADCRALLESALAETSSQSLKKLLRSNWKGSQR